MVHVTTLLILGILLTGTQSRSIEKRSDDPNPLAAVVDRLIAQVDDMQARLDALDHRVAFSAQFSASQPTTQLDTAFQFDRVIFNDGNAYDPMLGIFTAPFPGVYTFSVQAFTYGGERPVVDIRLNGGVVHRMAVDTSLLGDSQNGEDSTSMTVNLKLVQGDRVWVASIIDQMVFWGSVHTFFTGALLYTV